jgi:hypothetical protein
MHINYIKLPGLPRGIRVNEFSTVEELDKAIGPGSTIEFANNYLNTYYLRRRAFVVIAACLQGLNQLKRETNEAAPEYIDRFIKLATAEVVQTMVDKIEPLQHGLSHSNEPVAKIYVDRARVIFANQRHDYWAAELARNGINIGPWTTDHESNIMLLAQGLKRYNDREMEREFV